MSERSAWIALSSVEGVGELTFAALIAEFGSAADALEAANSARLDDWLAKRRRLDGRLPMTKPTVRNLREIAGNPDKAIAQIAERGLWTLTPLDADYPRRLRDLDPPPATIHGRGEPAALRTAKAVAVVGTRTPTAAGRALATKVAIRLVECGAAVVSGLAIGIDGAAHAATLSAGGTTVGVIGGGHDSPGPRAHARLREDVSTSGGAVISEYHPTASPRRGSFPRRNRIIAALGDATIVVEAPIHSGARITAARALELGRTVLVAPGRVGDWATAGSLVLLRETPAQPLVGLDEMVEDLALLARADADGNVTQRVPVDDLVATLGPAEQAVARRLIAGPAPLDAIVADTELSPAVASSAVTLLLMRGWVQSVGPAYSTAGALAR